MTFKILILNKDNNFHELIKKWDKEIFYDENFTFFYANSEKAAMEFLEQHPDVDLVLGDVNEKDRYYSQFLNKCQLSNPFHRYILISDNEKKEKIQAALNEGVYEHLKKPLKNKSFINTIHRSKKHLDKIKEHSKPESIRYGKLKKTMRQTVQAIAHICELKDPYTAGHQKRVAYIARAIAEHLNLDEFHIDEIYTAGLLHDVGKVTIPSEILSKPGDLSTQEMALVQQHTIAGFDILKNIDFPWNVKNLVVMHHERLDGSGYPNKYSMNEIPLGARIISVADVFEAVTSFRPYRPALGLNKGIEVLKEEAQNKRLDQIIVSACIDLISKEFLEDLDNIE